MANKKDIEEKTNNEVEFNLDKKVLVRNIANWTVTFARRGENIGDVVILPKASMRLSRNEIITQVYNGNKLFTGVDGKGTHATLIIEDQPTRAEVDFESLDGSKKQLVFSEENVKKVFSLKYDDFCEKFKETFMTTAEKNAVIESIKTLGINDYKKICFAEDYTGYKVN